MFFGANMQVQSNYNFFTNQQPVKKQSFGAAKDITLKYVYENRMHLLPPRMKLLVADIVENNKDIYEPLRDLHLRTYAPLRKYRNLEKIQSLFPEFAHVLQADNVVKRKTHNMRAIMESIPLEKFSVFMLKERWGKLKSLDEIAQELGIKDRSALSWFVAKIGLPDIDKNYQILVKASDAKLNAKIAGKTRAYNTEHKQFVIDRNRQLSEQNKGLNREIAREAWRRLPHIREALSEHSAHTSSSERFASFWSKYPEYAGEYGAMKRQIAKEIRDKKNNL